MHRIARRVRDGKRTHQNRIGPPTAACIPWLSVTASSHTASESTARPRVTADMVNRQLSHVNARALPDLDVLGAI